MPMPSLIRSMILLCFFSLSSLLGSQYGYADQGASQSYPLDKNQSSKKSSKNLSKESPQYTNSKALNEKRPDYEIIPKKRGFWGTFFFWLGGIICMYVVGRKVFKEQAHQRRTLRRLRDELGHFFPEFEPINIKKWVTIASEHLYHSWRERDLSTMESFCTPRFIQNQQQYIDTLNPEHSHSQDQLHLVNILAVHTLGMKWCSTHDTPHPPQGVELTLRVETKELIFDPDLDIDTLQKKKTKPYQNQYIWTLTHNGKTWELDDVKPSQGDLTELDQIPPLPEISQWRRPELS